MTDLFDPDAVLPAAFVPTPTQEFNVASARRNAGRQTVKPALELVRSADAASDRPSPKSGLKAIDRGLKGDPVLRPFPIPIPFPLPILFGSRSLIYKQDPSVAEIGIRKVFLRGLIAPGPKTARIAMAGVAPVSPNSMSDFIQVPGSEAFDTVQGFSVVHQALTMCQRALGGTIKWQWNSGANTDPITVSPRAGVTMNAYYSRSDKALKFFYFNKPGVPSPAPVIYTVRSFDIVTHETGHAVLDSLKPGWIGASSNPQTGALHEAFGDLLAIFSALAQLDQVEALIVQTKGNLHSKSFLSDMAEEFGLALGRDNGLRNADNDKKLSEVTSEVHDLSQVFTGGIYDVLADMFVFDRHIDKEDEAHTLLKTAQYLFTLLLRGIQAAPATDATFAHVVNAMLTIAAADGKPVQYRNFLRNRFTLREVVVSPVPLDVDVDEHVTLAAVDHPHLTVTGTGLQDRSGCCGTLRLREYSVTPAMLAQEIADIRGGFGGGSETPELIAAE
ncbi:MAG: hypothetical protein V4595_06740 [Pseudomonadota bacterium]